MPQLDIAESDKTPGKNWRPATVFLAALHQLGWAENISAEQLAELLTIPESIEPAGINQYSTPSLANRCWLARVTQWQLDGQCILTPLGQQRIALLCECGWIVADDWPRTVNGLAQCWLGERFYIAKSGLLQIPVAYTTFVSSQLGRNKLRLPDWPELLDRGLRWVARDQQPVLLAKGTTLFEATKQFARLAGIPAIQLVLPTALRKSTTTTANWLAATLHQLSRAPADGICGNSVYLSPEISCEQVNADFECLPVQDRAVMCLADRLLVFHIRPNGHVASLLERRLKDGRFPTGSVFLLIAKSNRDNNFQASDADWAGWLDRGAVGWLVPQSDVSYLQAWSGCHVAQSLENTSVHQLCLPLSELSSGECDVGWRYLSHCTRGTAGPMPDESRESHIIRLWQNGRSQPVHPMQTLMQILREGRLRAASSLNRSGHPTVSLSAVPLHKLLERRRFRPHLGRWDWEPYGILFPRTGLPHAQPVIYGSEADYENLAPAQQAFFQPVDGVQDWSIEQEWRVVGDLDFRFAALHHCVLVFVRSRQEALHLARRFSYPVAWVDSSKFDRCSR
ncbi:MAG: hypothetical protein KF752_04770 [Pirellulaceae bacterium]|nr:hypothetical protein [Pirellulaceae bacterium]